MVKNVGVHTVGRQGLNAMVLLCGILRAFVADGHSRRDGFTVMTVEVVSPVAFRLKEDVLVTRPSRMLSREWSRIIPLTVESLIA